ncbi:hypothetical protein DICPUDRAFT_152723 [Dictyostelium purpureum]|uniref:VPS9 domain-containing protein n=1 Tax=Dictyostelium purpureum TaxID=5786 RepID=F0ZM44_DICPU|nr:uncharacterized protein DICPUDRAFT_152723 [Dictyostelium purpureum]EGC34981.1 hypothetical protein DICPUDRAFT_152723 [Dictyostelium purpureum]|eukprot:XP_003288506.1 hypothetical protein DICPUDRAFT_152723 [Dictyostelium purpureum]
MSSISFTDKNSSYFSTSVSSSSLSTLSISSAKSSSSSSSSSSLSLSTPLLPSLTQPQSNSSSNYGSPKTPNSLKSSINGISSGIDKISLYSKDTSCTLSCDTEREREIKEAEYLFQSIPDSSYNVTKINQWGKHQKRTLRLTSRGIENIRGEIVSSLYSYSDIKSIYNRDSETFVIEYHNASHLYVYRSSVAYEIVQEITCRLKLRQTTDKKKTSYDIALEYQKKLKAKNRQSEKILINFEQQQLANQLNATLPLSPDIGGSENSTFTSGSLNSLNNNNCYSDDQSSITSASPSASPPSTIVMGSSSDNAGGFTVIIEDDVNVESNEDTSSSLDKFKSKRATKLSQLLGNTEEQRIQAEVDKSILSPQSPERKAIQQFMSNLNGLLKNPSTAIMIVRQFIDTTKQNILSDRDSQLSKLFVQTPGTPQNEEISLSTIVEKSLEKSIIFRAHKQLSSIISQQVAKDEQLLQDAISKLQGKDQLFFGIKEEFVSVSNWKSAILELSVLSRNDIPHDKLDTILSSARAIYNSLNYEKNSKNKVYQDYFLSADDFLPIYLYVVVNSDVKDLEFANQFLWQLSDPDRLCGEGGYYLTVFSSILSLIKSLNMENIDKASIIDDLIPSINLKNESLAKSSSNSDLTNNSENDSEESDSDNETNSSFDIDKSSTNNNNNNNNNNSSYASGRAKLGSSWTGGTISNKKRTQSFNLGKDKSLK